ncbi:NTPase/helicase [Ranavirus ambystoma1]|uniref:NTPase/helicase n=1 Tax=Ranavirus ambystoma1 TaxID=265294 RepID=A0A0U2JDN4_9VIRU|nr:NTPase/helicase [Ambystoma tigrinum virus]
MSEKKTMECIYCFETVSTVVPCSGKCDTLICVNCFKGSMDALDTFPKCQCGLEYSPNELEPILPAATLRGLDAKVKRVWDDNIHTVSAVNAQLDDCKKTYLDALPLAASIATQSFLRKALDDYAAKITKTVEEKPVDCPAEFCMGFRVGGKPCSVCGCTECADCKALMNINKPHTCKAEDLESVKAMDSNYVKCPECKKSVEKIDGCNDMTCAYCSTNFNYRTGLKQRGGSHNRIYLTHHQNLLSVKFQRSLSPSTLDALKRLETAMNVIEPPKIYKRYTKKIAYEWISKRNMSTAIRREYGNISKEISALTVDDVELHLVSVLTKFNII